MCSDRIAIENGPVNRNFSTGSRSKSADGLARRLDRGDVGLCAELNPLSSRRVFFSNARGTARVPPMGYQTPSSAYVRFHKELRDASGEEPTYCVK